MKNSVKTFEGLKKYKLLIIAAALGLVLLLLPSNSNDKYTETSDEQRLENLLENTQGVGETNVLLSENGAVIVCAGADMAEIKLTVMRATAAFTGLTTDKIQIFKLEMED